MNYKLSDELSQKMWKELAEKHAGKYVAVIDTEIVAVSDSEVDAFKTAKAKHPGKLVSIRYAPPER